MENFAADFLSLFHNYHEKKQLISFERGKGKQVQNRTLQIIL